MYHKILIPTDFSVNARKAGKHAIWIADKTDAEIVILNVVDVNYLQPTYLPNFNKNLDKCLKNEAEQTLEDFENDLIKSQCDGLCENIKFRLMIREGRPYREILKIIDEESIDLVVMGASGRHGVEGYLLGNVAERVLRESKTPVLIVN